MSNFVVMYTGTRGGAGPSTKGDPGDEGPGFRARGEWDEGQTYAPGDAVTHHGTAAAGIQSLFVQRADVPSSPSLLAPRLDVGRWAEIGALDLSNVTGAIWRVYQLAHGFEHVGAPVGYSAAADRWVPAANKIGGEIGVGVIREVLSVDEFIVQTSGDITGLDPAVIWPEGTSAFVPGQFYYVDSRRGRLNLEPTVDAPGFAANAMLLATGATSGVVLQWQQTPNVIGRRPVGYRDFYFTGTAGQTVITGGDLDGNPLIYQVSDQTEVYIDGLRVSPRGGFTATTGVSVVLAAALSGGEAVTVRVLAEPLAAIAPATAVITDNIAPQFDGIRRRFPLTVGGGEPLALGPASNVLVWLDGNTQEPFTDYLVIAGEDTTSDIEFVSAPPTGTRYWALAGAAISNLAFLEVNTLVAQTTTTQQLNFLTANGGSLQTDTLDADDADFITMFSETGTFINVTVTGILDFEDGVGGALTLDALGTVGLTVTGVATIAGLTLTAGTANTFSVTGVLSAGSANITGAMTAGSAAIPGSLTAGSVTVSGAMAANSLNVVGTSEANILRAAQLRGPTAGGQIEAFDLTVDEGVF